MNKRVLFTTLLLGLPFAVHLFFQSRRYRIARLVSRSAFLNTLALKQLPKIPYQQLTTPHLPLIRKQFVYPEDQKDFFYYEQIRHAEPTNSPVIVVPPLGGHSKLGCVRRATHHYYKQGRDVFVLLPRSATEMHPDQKKLRHQYQGDDLARLANLVGRCSLVSYGSGAFPVLQLLSQSPEQIEKAAVLFAPHDVGRMLHQKPEIERELGAWIISHIGENKQYYLNQGFSEDLLDHAMVRHQVHYLDELICQKLQPDQNGANMLLEDFYEQISLKQMIPRLKSEVLFVSCRDDVVNGRAVLEQEIAASRSCSLVVLNKGNYLGTRCEGGDVVSQIVGAWLLV